jgi:predicted SprT family Zn-dependent metalloprotease
MTKMEAFQLALAELGDAPAEALSAHIAHRFRLTIDPKFIPFFRASLRDLENLTRQRAAARATAPPDLFPVSVDAATTTLPTLPTLPDGPARFAVVRRYAVELMAAHGLAGWSFAYNHRKQAMGLCVYQRLTIELSVHFVERNSAEEVHDTILHEIAHALVGPGHGHDAVWKRKCLEIGARAQRCGAADMPEGHWQAECANCRRRYHRHRQPKRMKGWFCRRCGAEQGRLTWTSESSSS